MRRIQLSTVVALAAIPSVSFAADLLVPQEFDTIQSAIDAAVAGDRVLVAPGTYSGPIDFLGKSIVVEGAAGADSTVLDGLGAVGFVVRVDGGAEATFRGFTVTGGFGQAGSFGAGPGGGMRVNNASAVVDACVFSINSGIFGGAVSVELGSVTILDSAFEANFALRGGAVDVEQGSITIERTTFVENMASNDGGALSVLWLADATLRDVTFRSNAANSFANTIIAGHDTVGSTEIAGNGQVFLTNSLVQGSTFNADIDGTSIVGIAPLLDEHFVPLPGSPAIDAGSNAALPADVVFDLLGNARVVDALGAGAIVDIGASELPSPASDDSDTESSGQETEIHGTGNTAPIRATPARPTMSPAFGS